MNPATPGGSSLRNGAPAYRLQRTRLKLLAAIARRSEQNALLTLALSPSAPARPAGGWPENEAADLLGTWPSAQRGPAPFRVIEWSRRGRGQWPDARVFFGVPKLTSSYLWCTKKASRGEAVTSTPALTQAKRWTKWLKLRPTLAQSSIPRAAVSSPKPLRWPLEALRLAWPFPLPVSAGSSERVSDPILAAIERHRRAYHDWMNGFGEDEIEAAVPQARRQSSLVDGLHGDPDWQVAEDDPRWIAHIETACRTGIGHWRWCRSIPSLSLARWRSSSMWQATRLKTRRGGLISQTMPAGSATGITS